MQSVTEIQGNGMLAASAYMVRDCLRKMKSSVMKCLDYDVVKKLDEKLYDALLDWSISIDQCLMRRFEGQYEWYRLNPILAGAVMLDYLRAHHHISTMAIQGLSSLYRATGHLYNAFRCRDLIPTVPWMDAFIDTFDKAIFCPSRPTGKETGDGAFLKALMLSNHLTAASVSAMMKGKAQPTGNVSKVRTRIEHVKLSFTLNNLLHAGGAASLGLRGPALMRKIIEVADQEQFGSTPILSLDLLFLHDTFHQLFVSLRDQLDSMADFENHIPADYPGQSEQFRTTQALEDCVTYPIFTGLDAKVQDPGLDSYLVKTAGVFYNLLCKVDTERIFLLPASPNAFSMTFGRDIMLPSGQSGKAQAANESQLFSDVMCVLEDAAGPLSLAKMNGIKRKIISCKGMLYQISPYDDLASILHHAMLGPAADEGFAEWLVVLGAYTCGLGSPFDLAYTCAERGNEIGLLLLLDSYQRSNINVPDTNAGDTLLHVASRCGKKEIVTLLLSLRADSTIRNSMGKLPRDVAVDSSIRALFSKNLDEVNNDMMRLERHTETVRSRNNERNEKALEDRREQLYSDLALRGTTAESAARAMGSLGLGLSTDNEWTASSAKATGSGSSGGSKSKKSTKKKKKK
jgi:hypothetical protein